MANNYLEFSEIIKNITPKELEWWEKREQEISKAYEEDPDNADDDDTMCLDFNIEISAKQIWFNSDENGDPNKVAGIVQQFLKLFRPYECFSLTWACWCSKPRIGAFEGGAMFVTANEIKFYSAYEWLDQIKKEMGIK